MINNLNLAQIFANAPTVANRKDKSLRDLLVGAKVLLASTLKGQQTLVFSDMQAFSYSRILERQSGLSD